MSRASPWLSADISGSSATAIMYFGDEVSGTRGQIRYNNVDDSFSFYTDMSKAITNASSQKTEFDGIITNNYQIVPQIATADCVPLFIYDSVEKFYGVIHCGWKGIANKIHIKAVESLIERGCNKNNLKIFTGPSIKKCCYEIGEDIIRFFHSTCIHNTNKQYYLDLTSQITIDLINLNIKRYNIAHSNVCTFHNENCHSFRRDGSSSGRMYSMIIKI